MPVELTSKTLARVIDNALETEAPRVPWSEGEAGTPPPLSSALSEARRELVRWLNRKGKLLGRPSARAIAARMAQCKPLRRCLSGACPECSSGLQRAVVEASNSYRRARERKGLQSKVVTLVAKGCRFKPFDLSSPDILNTWGKVNNELVGRLIKATGDHVGADVSGAIDLSLNVDLRQPHEACFVPAFKTHWRPHIQIHLDADLWKRIEKDLRKEFPSAGQIAKPVVATNLDLNPQADAYLMKRLWEPGHRGRRETYVDRSISTLFPQAKTRLVTLRVEERLDQLIHLDALGLSRRLVLIGCRLKMTAKGPRIRPIK